MRRLADRDARDRDERAGHSALRIRRPPLRRAFVSHFGGVIVPIDEVERALHADAAAEDAYDRLAAAYDFEA